LVEVSTYLVYELHLGANYRLVAFYPYVKRKSGIMHLVIQLGW